MPLLETEREVLLRIAADSIQTGFSLGRAPGVNITGGLSEALRAPAATFVTIERAERLRGCIGTLVARDPLVIDVARNAFDAAFRDPRFPPVSFEELSDLSYHISILSKPVPLSADYEEDLLRKLRPGTDGLILTDGVCRATFLPAVWEKLGDPREFLRELKLKAGLPPHHWSTTIRFETYTCEVVR